MGQYSPETLLGLLAAAGLGLLLIALLIRALTRPRTDAPMATASPMSGDRPVPPAKSPNVPAPVQAVRPGPSQPTAELSYAAIAAAQAGPLRATTAEPLQPARIDYSGQPLGVPPGSSYTAIAVATHQR